MSQAITFNDLIVFPFCFGVWGRQPPLVLGVSVPVWFNSNPHGGHARHYGIITIVLGDIALYPIDESHVAKVQVVGVADMAREDTHQCGGLFGRNVFMIDH